MDGLKRPAGDITTLIDLAPRDRQDNDFFPLQTQETWFTRDPERRLMPSVPVVADFPFRGPAAFGQRFTFDIGSIPCGDVLTGCAIQIRLSHWLDLTTQLAIQTGTLAYENPLDAWFYCNSLGTALIEKAELEIDGVTIEELDGDFCNAWSLLAADYNTQIGVALDHLGKVSVPKLLSWPPTRIFPTEDGILHCSLPFFFSRVKYQEALPMIAMKEGLARIHVTFRPFTEVLRQARGFRDSCTSTPTGTTLQFVDTTVPFLRPVPIAAVISDPGLDSVRLITFGSILDGKMREAMMRHPFEVLHRLLQTFYFAEPLKYTIAKTGVDRVRVQLPLEANHPLEEIVWFVRRKDVLLNNEWTNYSSVLEKEYDATYNAPEPLLISAAIQVNGVTLVEAEEGYFRELGARTHHGGIAPYKAFVYCYPFARHPSEHQPSGTLNASRVQSLRLVLDVKGGAEWEVKVFCLGLNWLRFQNGLANKMFSQ